MLHRTRLTVAQHRSASAGPRFSVFFFFNDTATTEIYTLSLHDALPICALGISDINGVPARVMVVPGDLDRNRSEEHTSELQSQSNLVCRLLLEKKNNLPTTGDLVILAKHSALMTLMLECLRCVVCTTDR